MKFKYIFLISILCFVSCKKKEVHSIEPKSQNEIKELPKCNIEIINKKDTLTKEDIKNDSINEIENENNYIKIINFEKFTSEKYIFSKKAKLDFTSNSGAKFFKTRIIETYNSNKIDFASYYITVIFGCGASCIGGFIVDTRDGKIYDIPLGEEHSCLWAEERAVYIKNSKLFIAGICKENPEEDKIYYDASLWNEGKKVFENINEIEILKKLN